jgi:hypothetical protein
MESLKYDHVDYFQGIHLHLQICLLLSASSDYQPGYKMKLEVNVLIVAKKLCVFLVNQNISFSISFSEIFMPTVIIYISFIFINMKN